METKKMSNHRLSKTIKQITILAAMNLAVIPSGCGLKTLPRSDVKDLRPSIPLRIKAAKPLKKKGEIKNKSNRSNQNDL